MAKKVFKVIYDSAIVIGFLFGLGGIGGAIDNGTSFVLPAVMFIASLVMLVFEGKWDEVKVHDYTRRCESDNRLYFLH